MTVRSICRSTWQRGTNRIQRGYESMSTSSISRDDIFSAVVEAVCSIGKGRINKDGITPESRFNEIGIDSFGVMTLLVTLEGQLKIDLSALGQMEVKLMTVDDAVGLIEAAVSQ